MIMRRVCLVTAIVLVILNVFASGVIAGGACSGARGKVLESLEFDSKILGRGVKYSVYLPADYDISIRHYSVVYLLHGAGDDETTWIQRGEVHLAADRAIASREIPAMIIVMPDAALTWYINDYTGKVRYENMFVEEFIPYIDRTYRTRAEKRYRGISGLSMGGYGSLIMAMRHPDLFTACAAFSSGVQTSEELIAISKQQYERTFAKAFGEGLVGEARLTEHYQKYNPLHQAKTLPKKELRSVHWYIDCGDDDFLYKGNSALHVILRDRKIPHEYRVRDGGHNWAYWRTNIVKGLKLIGEDFRK